MSAAEYRHGCGRKCLSGDTRQGAGFIFFTYCDVQMSSDSVSIQTLGGPHTNDELTYFTFKDGR